MTSTTTEQHPATPPLPTPPAAPKAGWSTRRKVVVGIVVGFILLTIGAGIGGADQQAPTAAPASTETPSTKAPTTAPTEAPEVAPAEPTVDDATVELCTIVRSALERPAGSASRSSVLAEGLFSWGNPDLDLVDMVDDAYWSMSDVHSQARLEAAGNRCDKLGA